MLLQASHVGSDQTLYLHQALKQDREQLQTYLLNRIIRELKTSTRMMAIRLSSMYAKVLT
jgi:outer membrane protein assembly factor BamA